MVAGGCRRRDGQESVQTEMGRCDGVMMSAKGKISMQSSKDGGEVGEGTKYRQRSKQYPGAGEFGGKAVGR